MKKILPLFSMTILVILLLAACNQKSQADTADGKVLTYTDTVGLADFQKWKVQNELKDPSVYYRQGAERTNPSSASSNGGGYKSTRSRSLTSVGDYPAKTTAKKGWSRKAKGAVIGGGGGAIIGALIDKHNRLAGGAIGGALGAGLGYVIGNELDRKHGR